MKIKLCHNFFEVNNVTNNQETQRKRRKLEEREREERKRKMFDTFKFHLEQFDFLNIY